MTSAHQAGVLELIFKEKSRGLRSSQEKGSSDNWKERGIYLQRIKTDQSGFGQARGDSSGTGRRWLLADEEHVGAKLTFCPTEDMGNCRAKRGTINFKKNMS